MLIINVGLILKSTGFETLPAFFQKCKKLRKTDELEKWMEVKRKNYEADQNNYVLETIYKDSKEYVRLI